MSAIVFDQVEKSFADRRVLNGLSLSVPETELTALVGVNGAGKTTGIKALLDFSSIDTGSIKLFGESNTRPASREKLAFLPERFNPPYFLTGAEYLSTMAKLYGHRFDAGNADAMCESLDLDASALARPVRTYSKGMAQKLGLAGVFLSGRQLLLLDEPMSGLDPKARILVKKKMRGAVDGGQTVFFTTHMLADVEALADRIVMLHGGRAVFEGTVSEFLRHFDAADLETAFLSALAQA